MLAAPKSPIFTQSCVFVFFTLSLWMYFSHCSVCVSHIFNVIQCCREFVTILNPLTKHFIKIKFNHSFFHSFSLSVFHWINLNCFEEAKIMVKWQMTLKAKNVNKAKRKEIDFKPFFAFLSRQLLHARLHIQSIGKIASA